MGKFSFTSNPVETKQDQKATIKKEVIIINNNPQQNQNGQEKIQNKPTILKFSKEPEVDTVEEEQPMQKFINTINWENKQNNKNQNQVTLQQDQQQQQKQINEQIAQQQDVLKQTQHELGTNLDTNEFTTYSNLRLEYLNEQMKKLWLININNTQIDKNKKRYNSCKLVDIYRDNIDIYRQKSDLIDSKLIVQLYKDVFQNKMQKERNNIKIDYDLLNPFNFHYEKTPVTTQLQQEFNTFDRGFLEDLQYIDGIVNQVLNKISQQTMYQNMDQLLSDISQEVLTSNLKQFPLISVYAFLTSIIYKCNLDIKFQSLYCQCLLTDKWQQDTRDNFISLFKEKQDIKSIIEQQIPQQESDSQFMQQFIQYVINQIIKLIQDYQIHNWNPISNVYRQQKSESEEYFKKLHDQYMRNNCQLLGQLFLYDLIDVDDLDKLVCSLTFADITSSEQPKIELSSETLNKQTHINLQNIKYLTTLYNHVLQALFWKADIQCLQWLIENKKQIQIDVQKVQNNIFKLQDLDDEILNSQGYFHQYIDSKKEQWNQAYKLYQKLALLYNQTILPSLSIMDAANQFQIEEIQFQIDHCWSGNQIQTYKTVIQLYNEVKPQEIVEKREKCIEVTEQNFQDFLYVYNEAGFTVAAQEVFKLQKSSSPSEFRKVMKKMISLLSQSNIKEKMLNKIISQMIQFAKTSDQREQCLKCFSDYCENQLDFEKLISEKNAVKIFIYLLKYRGVDILKFIEQLYKNQTQNKEAILNQVFEEILFDEEADPIDNLFSILSEDDVYEFINQLARFYKTTTQQALQDFSYKYEIEEIIEYYKEQMLSKQTIDDIVQQAVNYDQKSIQDILKVIFEGKNANDDNQISNEKQKELLTKLSQNNEIKPETVANTIISVSDNAMNDLKCLTGMLNLCKECKPCDLKSLCKILDCNDKMVQQIPFIVFKNSVK